MHCRDIMRFNEMELAKLRLLLGSNCQALRNTASLLSRNLACSKIIYLSVRLGEPALGLPKPRRSRATAHFEKVRQAAFNELAEEIKLVDSSAVIVIIVRNGSTTSSPARQSTSSLPGLLESAGRFRLGGALDTSKARFLFARSSNPVLRFSSSQQPLDDLKVKDLFGASAACIFRGVYLRRPAFRSAPREGGYYVFPLFRLLLALVGPPCTAFPYGLEGCNDLATTMPQQEESGTFACRAPHCHCLIRDDKWHIGTRATGFGVCIW
ncbi:uncharacterized protein EV420DRAFT_1730535 [Desarmillaria tabescens]|uniref:Uncharacterized protein n=1 Tax=Armillaria tabescens TaxID=1929756 RepID=A0AA39JE22_ARMTA|nr:uncharacterized protein EV420DRAFT_1730535 [Desarmillaria tabescens]KAK0440903.1 hypothetical protein EV420DRAFT_1730535 [Desarmillaria tabescens]